MRGACEFEIHLESGTHLTITIVTQSPPLQRHANPDPTELHAGFPPTAAHLLNVPSGTKQSQDPQYWSRPHGFSYPCELLVIRIGIARGSLNQIHGIDGKPCICQRLSFAPHHPTTISQPNSDTATDPLTFTTSTTSKTALPLTAGPLNLLTVCSALWSTTLGQATSTGYQNLGLIKKGWSVGMVFCRPARGKNGRARLISNGLTNDGVQGPASALPPPAQSFMPNKRKLPLQRSLPPSGPYTSRRGWVVNDGFGPL
jgi:hypothetical protein